MKKIHIGGIPYGSVQGEFVEFVESKVGPIAEIVWITNKHDGSFRGFAFVIFQNENDDLQAMLILNNHEYEGRMLKVSEATPMRQR